MRNDKSVDIGQMSILWSVFAVILNMFLTLY